MDNKYQISKSKEPETKQEIIQHQIEELVKRRDKESDLKAKQVRSYAVELEKIATIGNNTLTR